MKITKALRSELLSFAISIVPQLIGGNINDLDAVELTLEKLLDLVRRENAANVKR